MVKNIYFELICININSFIKSVSGPQPHLVLFVYYILHISNCLAPCSASDLTCGSAFVCIAQMCKKVCLCYH